MARRRTRLEVITPAEGATILMKGNPRGQPLFVGTDPDESNDNLVCGACGGLIGRGISLNVIRQRFLTPTQLVLQCDCGAKLFLAHGIAN